MTHEVLIASNDDSRAADIADKLTLLGYGTSRAGTTFGELIEAVNRLRDGVLLLDLDHPVCRDRSGLASILQAAGESPVVCLTEVPGDPRLSERGIAAWLLNPVSNVELEGVLNLALRCASLERQLRSLRINEERHRLALQAANDGVWEWDIKADKWHVSPSYCAVLGYEPGEFQGSLEAWKRLVHAHDLPGALLNLNRFLAGDTDPYRDEYRVRHKSGGHVWIGARALAVSRGEDGRVLRVVGAIADITARKNAELTSLRDQEELAAIYHEAPTMMLVVDRDRRIRKLNRLAMAAAGRSEVDAIGTRGGDALRCLFSLEHPLGCGFGPHCERCMVRSTVADTFATGRSHLQVQATLAVLKDGRQRTLTLLISTALLKLSEEPMVLISLLDITERKEAEAALRAGEERFIRFMQNLPAHAYVKDSSGKYLYVNENLERLLPGSGSFVGKTDLEIWPPETAAAFQANDRLALSQETPVTVEEEAVVDGLLHTFLSKKFRFPTADGMNLLGGVSLDITDRKQSETRLAETQRIESIGRLAGGIAHDFNNWLTVINGYGSLVLAKMSPVDPLRPALEQIHHAGEKAASLTRQLLSFSRKQLLEPSVLSINQVMGDMQALLTRLAGEAVDTRWKPGAKRFVCADRSQLEQALINVVSNARDAMPHGGSLTLETADVERDSRTCVMLAITDTGDGMDAETRRRIFEPFYTTKAVGKGTGLGLSMVQGFVAQSDGFIEVDSEPGRGTQFRIYFPSVEGEVKKDEVGAAEVTPLSFGETVLVVEDQAEVLQYVVAALRGAGFRVLEATSAEVAQSICRKERIDLLLTDVIMPACTGPELAARLRSVQQEMAVLFMSGYAAEPGAALPQSALLINKPFSPGQLAAKVREALGPVRRSGHILVVDDQPEVRSYLHDVLTGAGYKVTEAGDGAEASNAVRRGHPDLVVIDLVMPVQEGIETIQMLRQEVPGLKILAISGDSGGRYLRAAKVLGAHAILGKPIDARTLLATLSELLREPPPLSSSQAAG